MPVGPEYWASLQPPLSPTDADVEIFRQHMRQGTTLLLGCTRQLIPLSDVQMDLDPWYAAPTVVRQDWVTNSVQYTNILADGSLNLGKNLCDQTLEMCSHHASVLIARVFSRRLISMRVASYFPAVSDFLIAPAWSLQLDSYAFHVWQFGGGH
jgi:hypothetical protein